MKETLRSVPLFEDLEEADLDALSAAVSTAELGDGEVLFAEGDDGESAYVIDGGEIEIVKVNDDRETLLAVRKPGEVIGEMALLNAAPRMATARAAGATRVIAIPKAALDDLLQRSATAARGLFRVLLDRWAQTEAMLRQSERMAQLGTLTAGLAHELNNPAAAVASSAQQLREAILSYQASMEVVAAVDLSTEQARSVRTLLDKAASPPVELSALDRSDREVELEDRFEALSVPEPWSVASDLASAGFTGDEVDEIATSLGQGHEGEIWRAAQAAHRVAAFLYVVEEGSSRMSSIVGALKSYSYLDQAPEQEVDVRKGIDDTVLILKPKLRDIEVVKQYDADVPLIPAYAAELNQVWTNLIDNAADAINETRDSGGRLELRVRIEGEEVLVEVEDNGGGIPEEALPRIFDSFFTTKPPGSGTGLGLDITYNVVVHKHRGEITVHPVDGGTMFRVALPTGR